MDLQQRQCAQRVVSVIKEKERSILIQNQNNLDTKSSEKLSKLLFKDCCKLKCINLFKKEEIINYAFQFNNLEKKVQEITIYNELRLGIRKSFGRKEQSIFDYYIIKDNLEKIKVCQHAYCTFHIKSTDWIQKKQLLVKQGNFSFNEQRGKSQGQHNNQDKEEQLNTYMDNYLQEFIYPSPKNGEQLLPACFTIHDMYEKYKKISINPYSLSKVKIQFQTNYPLLKKQKMYSDYCNQCSMLLKNIIKSKDEQQHKEYKELYQSHLDDAKRERSFYVLNKQETKLFNDDEQAMISFDWSQDILFPKYRIQPAKLYFMQKQKCGLFVIVDEKKNQPCFYSIPEKDMNSYSKNFDLTFSLLYHYLTKCLKKTKRLIIQMDNCPATNKNNFAFQFFYYIVHSLNMFEEIVICFLVVGHTKFSPDQWFGTIKNKINNYTDEIESYPQIIKIINSINLVQNAEEPKEMEEEEEKQNEMIEEKEKIIVHYSTSQDLDPNNYVKVFDWKQKLNEQFVKVTSEIKFFDNCYYRIHKKFEYIERKQKSDSEIISCVNITKNDIQYSHLKLNLEEKQITQNKEKRLIDLEKVTEFIQDQSIKDEFWKFA